MPLTERRSTDRESLELPIRLTDGRIARATNVCPSGLYLLLPDGALIPDWIRVDITLPTTRVRVHAYGEVVRVEQLANATGVALRLHHLQLSRRERHDA
ncbi:PilZ domain-containing protein [Ramlibacter sp. AW1]|uniref:PilZ domain-containing protein n=1 Tax=Ramlibacter aurantiacus TaxID=2801330 RepID=A0A936ZLP6_9BURK|nr:PilZ domain-containing protein [Ramlibacter aurantiacus]MBL0419583.1 PilZ domain-containing protein [Ramlibacter aurantiacus]